MVRSYNFTKDTNAQAIPTSFMISHSENNKITIQCPFVDKEKARDFCPATPSCY